MFRIAMLNAYCNAMQLPAVVLGYTQPPCVAQLFIAWLGVVLGR
jgi:hypothetical protein